MGTVPVKEALFFCKYCFVRNVTKAYTTHSSLKRHMQKAHPEVDYNPGFTGCNECGSIMPSRSKVLLHIKREHQSPWIPCKLEGCHMCFHWIPKEMYRFPGFRF